MEVETGFSGITCYHSGFLATDSAVSHHFRFKGQRFSAPTLSSLLICSQELSSPPRALPHTSKSSSPLPIGISLLKTRLPTPLNSTSFTTKESVPTQPPGSSLRPSSSSSSSFLRADASRAQSIEQHKAFSSPHSPSSPRLLLPCCGAGILPAPSSLLHQRVENAAIPLYKVLFNPGLVADTQVHQARKQPPLTLQKLKGW